MTEFEMLFESVRELKSELKSEIQALRGQVCNLHGELSEFKTEMTSTVARMDERQKAQSVVPVPEPPNRGKQAVAVTVSLAGLGGLGATVWSIVKALSSG